MVKENSGREITRHIKIKVLVRSSWFCFSSGAASAPSPPSNAPVLLVPPVSLTPCALDWLEGRVLGGQRPPVSEAGGQGARA